MILAGLYGLTKLHTLSESLVSSISGSRLCSLQHQIVDQLANRVRGIEFAYAVDLFQRIRRGVVVDAPPVHAEPSDALDPCYNLAVIRFRKLRLCCFAHLHFPFIF